MKASRKKNRTTIIVKTGTREEFFSRGKKIAKSLDEGKALDSYRAITFEDPEELVGFLNKMKMSLLKVLREQSYSISDLAKKLHRSRASVNNDVRALESVGIVKSEYVINPGHGRHRVVKAVDSKPIKLLVEALI